MDSHQRAEGWIGRQIRRRETHPVTDEAHAGAAEELDELGVQLVVGVPRPPCHLYGWLEVVEHVDLPGGVLRQGTLIRVRHEKEDGGSKVLSRISRT